MNDNLMLEIKNFGLINEANIEINKINVVGGINSSGKSTASRLLYGFLKANSLKQKHDLRINLVINVNDMLDLLNKPMDEFVSLNDDFQDIIKKYYSYKDMITDTRLIKEIDYIIELLSLSENEFASRLTLDYVKFGSLEYFADKSYYHVGQEFGHGGSARLYCDNFESSIQRTKFDNESMEDEMEYDIEDEYFDYKTEGTFKKVYDVFYISPISIFDINKGYNGDIGISRKYIYMLEESDKDLLDNLGNKSMLILSEDIKERIDNVKEKVQSIIQGNFKDSDSFNNEFYRASVSNTSSGTKQIGIIQMLLNMNRLIPKTFLILDEPEVNLHPEWQFKFAEILVLLAKELDVNIYINSHSPIFIESIDAFCEYYDMEDDVNFYLTEQYKTEKYEHKFIHKHMEIEDYYLTKEFETSHRFNFTKIESNELYKIYDNLGNPYHLIDQLRLKKRLGE